MNPAALRPSPAPRPASLSLGILAALAAGAAAGSAAVSGTLIQFQLNFTPGLAIAALVGALALLGMAARGGAA